MVVTSVVLTPLETKRLPNWMRGFIWPCAGKGKSRTCGDLFIFERWVWG
ncbi:hypothetical protein Hanom_Chr09g00759551 [Helianthus anomalus]